MSVENEGRRRRLTLKTLLLGLAAATLISALVVVKINQDGREVMMLSTVAEHGISWSGARVTSFNEYGSSEKYVNSGSPYPQLRDDNIVLVEPWRQNTRLEFSPGDTNLDGVAALSWRSSNSDVLRIELADLEEENGLPGITASANCTSTGSYSVVLTALDEHGSPFGQKEFIFRCLYVKRELRALNDADREITLDAMHKMWKYSETSKGQKKYYGTDNFFIGIDTFNTEHAREAASDVYCDRWHEGTGFLWHHLALSYAFEQSMRAVHPGAVLPYWDFTIEGSFVCFPLISKRCGNTIGQDIYNEGGGPSDFLKYNDWILTDEWFGAVDTESKAISSGRWRHATVTLASEDNRQYANALGYMRAPWNMNPSPHVSRHLFDVCGLEPIDKPIPYCEIHYELANQTSLFYYLKYIAGQGHGPMHVNTGGVYGGCNDTMRSIYADYQHILSKSWTSEEAFAHVLHSTGYSLGKNWLSQNETFTGLDLVQEYVHLEYFHIYRMLWRSQTCANDALPYHLNCSTPAGCYCAGASLPGSDDDNINTEFEWTNLEPCLYARNKTKYLMRGLLPSSLRKDLVLALCAQGQVYEGDMLENASPSDPLFFIIHPVLDRLTTAKRLSSQATIPFADLGHVRPFDNDTWSAYSYYGTDVCDGHGPHDAALTGHVDFKNALSSLIEAGFDEDDNGQISNVEFFRATDPVTGVLDYIYDSFSWDHCASSSRRHRQ